MGGGERGVRAEEEARSGTKGGRKGRERERERERGLQSRRAGLTRPTTNELRVFVTVTRARRFVGARIRPRREGRSAVRTGHQIGWNTTWQINCGCPTVAHIHLISMEISNLW